MTTTPNKGYTVPTVGADYGTWGTELNTDLSIIDSNLGGVLTLSVAGNSNVTANATQAQNLITILTGILTGNIQYILPATGGMYIIQNSTTGAFTVTIASSGGGSTVALPQGTILTFVCDATNIALANQGFVQTNAAATVTTLHATGVGTFDSNLNVTGSLSVAGSSAFNSGGTALQVPNGQTILNILSTTGATSNSVNGFALTPSGTGAVSGNFNVGISCNSGMLAGNYFAVSDERVKSEIETISAKDALHWIKSARPVTYLKNDRPEAGFIAQEQARAGFGQYVNTTPNKKLAEVTHEDGSVSKAGYELSLNYDNYVAYLTRVVQMLTEKVEALESGYVK